MVKSKNSTVFSKESRMGAILPRGLVDLKSGKEVETSIEPVTSKKELKGFSEGNGWYVDWDKFGGDVQIFKVTANGGQQPEGLMAFKDNPDRGAIDILWIVAAPHNQGMVVKKNKKFDGVPGVLFSKAIDESIQKGYNGDVHGEAANSRLLDYYIKEYGATPLGGKYEFFIGDYAAATIRRKYKWR